MIATMPRTFILPRRNDGIALLAVCDSLQLSHPMLWKWRDVAWTVGVLVNIARHADVVRVGKREAP